ncbi:PREDICTED: putative F-box protein At1g47730 [Fragaria vesca subsp. vesca]|uniref:putative F-box protein At1g47730 n=1 Tax=Fragaria vesca subsp. vesca TaxID=101020 RepID=UPI0002C2E390|nr:PREDICTED: putative F-box protein At1g47730 [Fragaria vesca subsp. vesca]XP_011466168.1 PREDICTED: putative F-box protein At1g47730 [Fragaria vesca subsp. vesca]
MTEFCKIPEAMALQILSGLPPKSLMRFKCVHKSWHALMKDPNFVAKHLSNSMLNNLYSTTGVLFKREHFKVPNAAEKGTESFSLISISNDNGDSEHDTHCLVEDITEGRQFSGIEVLESARIIGHCHGIICLRNATKVILWNPAIREVKITTPYVPDENLGNLGIGYDPKSNNYKVVHISYGTQEEHGDGHFLFDRPKGEVYTIGTDSWRQIMTGSSETATTKFWFQDFHMYFNGVCYWNGREQLKDFHDFYDAQEEFYIRPVIISFDMGDEVFHKMLLPDFVYGDYMWCYVLRLMAWNESVAIFGLDHGITDHESWGLWVMGDSGGVTGSWIKQFSFVSTVGFLNTPLQFWKSDEILIVSEERRLVSYNLYTEQFKHLPIHFEAVVYMKDHFEAVVYMNSIVSVNGNNPLV